MLDSQQKEDLIFSLLSLTDRLAHSVETLETIVSQTQSLQPTGAVTWVSIGFAANHTNGLYSRWRLKRIIDKLIRDKSPLLVENIHYKKVASTDKESPTLLINPALIFDVLGKISA